MVTNSGTASIQWNTPDVKNLFAKSLSTDTGTTLSSSLGPTSTSTATPRSPTPSNPANTSLIAGGIVSGLTTLVILATFIFYFIRRHRRRKAASQEPPKTHPELQETLAGPAEMQAQPKRFEVDDGYRAWEADGVSRTEMDGDGNVRWELDTEVQPEISRA